MGNQTPKTDKPVLVTGASGYISSYIIQYLLCVGYKVRGTVRSLENKDKYAHLLKFKGSNNLELVEAELTNEECWDKVVNGCDYVLHVASPIPPYVPKDQDQIIKPAVAGSINVLNASIKNKVKRFVFTSSCLALYFGNEEQLLDEGHWGDPAKCAHYPKSKILAERAIWQIYNKQNLQHYHTEVVSVLPSLVLGPGLTVHKNSSETLLAEILKGNFPGIPNPDIMYTVVDVRDAAIGHCYALFKPNLNGQRIALAAQKMNISQIIQILHDAYPKNNIKTTTLTLEQMKASQSPIVKRNLPFIGRRFQVNNKKSIQLLDMKYRSTKDTILQMAQQLVKLGVVQ